jgi:three-Cys-motif partner protein
MARDIHKSVFDEGTKIKLYVLEQYLREWLPVFLKGKDIRWDKIFVYDFFAGSGTDSENNPGSPLIIINLIKSFCKDIVKKNLQLKMVFNEINKNKFEKLVRNCNRDLLDCVENINAINYCPRDKTADSCVFDLRVENQDFQRFFDNIYTVMEKHPEYPRFMFLDQNGIKHITSDVVNKLVFLDRTDFIFFISSSFANRFVEIPEFKKYLNLSRQQFIQSKPYHCHRVIYNYYKSLLPKGKAYYLAPFSIKKGANIYGLIFGSHHTLGIEKFLNICWRINPQTGDANFDIDKERINPDSPSLFEELNISTKIQDFEQQLRTKIQNCVITTNIEMYNFTFEMECLPIHANKVVKEMQKENIISKEFEIANHKIHKLPTSHIIILN